MNFWYIRVCVLTYTSHLKKYTGFDWVVCRTRLPSLPTRTAGIWIPIAGFDGCRIEDEAGFTYKLLVGKKYQMLKPSRRVTLRVREGDVMHMLWLMKHKDKWFDWRVGENNSSTRLAVFYSVMDSQLAKSTSGFCIGDLVTIAWGWRCWTPESIREEDTHSQWDWLVVIALTSI